MIREHTTFDCGSVIAQAVQGRRRVNSGFQEMPTLHLFRVPKQGQGAGPGIFIDDVESLRELRRAIDHALGEQMP